LDPLSSPGRFYSIIAVICLLIGVINLFAYASITSENEERPEEEQQEPGPNACLCTTFVILALIFNGMRKRAIKAAYYRAQYQLVQEQQQAWQQQQQQQQHSVQQQAWQQHQQQQSWQQQQHAQQEKMALEQQVRDMQGLVSHMQFRHQSDSEQRKMRDELVALKEQLASVKEQQTIDREKPRINISVDRVGDDIISDSIVTNRPGERKSTGGDRVRDSVVSAAGSVSADDETSRIPDIAPPDDEGHQIPTFAPQEEARRCPGCQQKVESGWSKCPFCESPL